MSAHRFSRRPAGDPVAKRAMIDALRAMAREGNRPADLVRLTGGSHYYAFARRLQRPKPASEAQS